MWWSARPSVQPRGNTEGGSSPPIYDGRHKSKGTKLLRKIPGSVRLFGVQFSESNAQVGVRRQGVAHLDPACRKTCGIAARSMTLLHF